MKEDLEQRTIFEVLIDVSPVFINKWVIFSDDVGYKLRFKSITDARTSYKKANIGYHNLENKFINYKYKVRRLKNG